MKILIDGSNAWYRAYTATQLSQPGAAVSIMTYMLRKICNTYGKNNIIVSWDGGKSGRDQLDNQYKSQRQSVEGVWDDISYMKRMVDCLGLKSAYKEGFEADDVIGSLAVQSNEPCMILSYDKDFYQLVNNQISVLRPERTIRGQKVAQQIINNELVIEEFGCSSNKVVLYKCFRGDNSDNIPKISIKFVKSFSDVFYQVLLKVDSVSEFYDNILSFDKKYYDELLNFKDRALLNEKIVKIKVNLDVLINDAQFNPENFENLCQEIEITKLKVSDWKSMIAEPMAVPIQNSLF